MEKILNDFVVNKEYQKGDVLPASEVNRLFNQVKDVTSSVKSNTTNIGNKVDSNVLNQKIEELKSSGLMDVYVSKTKITRDTKIVDFPINKITINVIAKEDVETAGFTQFTGKSLIVMTNYLNGVPESAFQVLRADDDTSIYTRVYDKVSGGWKALEKISNNLNVISPSAIKTEEAYDEVGVDKLSIVGFESANASTPNSELGALHIFKSGNYGTELFFGFNNELCFRVIKGASKGPWVDLLNSSTGLTVTAFNEFKENNITELGEMTKRIEAIEEANRAKDEKITALEKSLENAQQEYNNLSQSYDTLNSSLENNNNEINTLKEKIAFLEGKITELTPKE